MAPNIKNIESLAEFHEIINGEEPAMIDFWATWCGPCKIISPIYESIANQTKGMRFYKVDTDKLQAIAHEVGIRAMPTFMVFERGQKVGTILGARPQQIRDAVERFKLLEKPRRVEAESKDAPAPTPVVAPAAVPAPSAPTSTATPAPAATPAAETAAAPATAPTPAVAPAPTEASTTTSTPITPATPAPTPATAASPTPAPTDAAPVPAASDPAPAPAPAATPTAA